MSSDGPAVYTAGISQRRAGATTYDLHDQLGTATKQTSASASTTATRTYDAFGMLASTTGSPQGPFGFAGTSGYQEDGDSDLKLLGHRYYDPSTGRFLTRDPAKDGRNWYDYCDANPLRWIDSDGLQTSKGNQKSDEFNDWDNDKIQNTLDGMKGKQLTPSEKILRGKLQREQKARNQRHHRTDYNDSTRAIVTELLIYEGLKWGIAWALAPETLGGSVAGAALLP